MVVVIRMFMLLEYILVVVELFFVLGLMFFLSERLLSGVHFYAKPTEEVIRAWHVHWVFQLAYLQVLFYYSKFIHLG